MDNKKNFLKDCINTVAGLEINNESQAIAKEVALSTLESLEKENTNLKQALNKIREYVNSDKLLKIFCEPKINNKGETYYDIIRKDILQIIEKVEDGNG